MAYRLNLARVYNNVFHQSKAAATIYFWRLSNVATIWGWYNLTAATTGCTCILCFIVKVHLAVDGMSWKMVGGYQKLHRHPAGSSLMFRPHPFMRKRVWWLLSDFLVVGVSSLDFGQTNEIVLCHPSVYINQWSRPYVMQACNRSLFKINSDELAQPWNHSIVTRPIFNVRGWGLSGRGFLIFKHWCL